MDASYLIKKLDLNIPLIGIYDAPADTGFGDIVTPPGHKHACFFAYYKKWLKGATVRLSHSNYGCGGCGTWLFGETTRSREDYISFLADDEGLKASHELMGAWMDHMKPHVPENGFLFIGPLNQAHNRFLKTVTFFVNPDQLSVLMIGAQYFHHPGDPEPVSAPFGSGCMQALTHFSDDRPMAIIGATDMAMRKYLPANILAFTVNVPMFKLLCSIDKDSFLEKPFLKDLKKARKGSL
ncbi:MAG: DUF169 domain-containing protein [Bacteroidales bacterium]|jgi:hypothetical protein|nr:DUF169 domain-containing protein [Bacteroidales bacterium]